MATNQTLDELDVMLLERAASNPTLPAQTAARTSRRILQHRLPRRRVEVGTTLAEAGLAMTISKVAVARIESGEHDVRVLMLERYALPLDSPITMKLEVAP